MSERSERVIEALAAHRFAIQGCTCGQHRHPLGKSAVIAHEGHLAAVLDALGDDPAQATVERVEALAWVTQDICDCDSMKGRAGAHRDECPVMVLRAALDPETGP